MSSELADGWQYQMAASHHNKQFTLNGVISSVSMPWQLEVRCCGHHAFMQFTCGHLWSTQHSFAARRAAAKTDAEASSGIATSKHNDRLPTRATDLSEDRTRVLHQLYYNSLKLLPPKVLPCKRVVTRAAAAEDLAACSALLAFTSNHSVSTVS